MAACKLTRRWRAGCDQGFGSGCDWVRMIPKCAHGLTAMADRESFPPSETSPNVLAVGRIQNTWVVSEAVVARGRSGELAVRPRGCLEQHTWPWPRRARRQTAHADRRAELADAAIDGGEALAIRRVLAQDNARNRFPARRSAPRLRIQNLPPWSSHAGMRAHSAAPSAARCLQRIARLLGNRIGGKIASVFS